MFRWYQNAAVCYAYLSDVSSLDEFEKSIWFTRGWTLQELVAPSVILFYSTNWHILGSKGGLATRIESITRIPERVLLTGDLDGINMATRMSWAANRQTSRTEDKAYCLMGIFQVHMPLLYGEGTNSFIRLQQEILKISHDPSLFAWALADNVQGLDSFLGLESNLNPQMSDFHGLLASSPQDFTFTSRIVVLDDLPLSSPTVAAGGVGIALPTLNKGGYWFANISCILIGMHEYYLTIPLRSWSHGSFSRHPRLVLIRGGNFKYDPPRLFIKSPSVAVPRQRFPIRSFTVIQLPASDPLAYFFLEDVYCSPHATYYRDTGRLILSEIRASAHAAFLFRPNRRPDVIIRLQRYSSFAIIVGGDPGHQSASWVKYFDIVPEEEAHSRKKAGEIPMSWATKGQLSSWISNRDTHLAAGEHLQIGSEFTRQADFMYMTNSVSHIKAPRRVGISMQISHLNVVEKGMYVMIRVTPEQTLPIPKAPDWWDYQIWESK
jgi:hypothetical protein